MRTTGSKNKPKSEPCYKGPSLSYEAYVTLYMKIHQPSEAKMLENYERFMADIKKTKFSEYRKSNYDFLVKTGLYQRRKSKYKL